MAPGAQQRRPRPGAPGRHGRVASVRAVPAGRSLTPPPPARQLDDAVGQRDEGRAVRHDRAPCVLPPVVPPRRARRPRSRRRDSPWARRAAAAARRGRTRGRARAAGARRPTVRRRPHRARVAAPSGSRCTTSASPAASSAAADVGVGRVRAAEPDVLGDRRGRRGGAAAAPRPEGCRQSARSRSARSTPPSRTDAGVGQAQAKDARPAGSTCRTRSDPVERDGLARPRPRGRRPSSAGQAPSRVGDGQPADLDAARAGALRAPTGAPAPVPPAARRPARPPASRRRWRGSWRRARAAGR